MASDKELALQEIQRRQQSGLWDYALGGLELLPAVGSAIVAEPLAGLAGLVAAPTGRGGDVVEGVRERLTYRPRTDEARQIMQGIGESVGQAVGDLKTKGAFYKGIYDLAQGSSTDKVAKDIAQARDFNVSQTLGDATLSATGSPLLATAAYSAPTALAELAGFKALPKMGREYELGDIREATAGPGRSQAGIFAGIKAKEANLDQMAAAQELADRGVSRDVIWSETGWFKDVDGNWKFEIDDSERMYTPLIPADLAEIKKYESRVAEASRKMKDFAKQNSEAYKNPPTPEHKDLLMSQMSQLQKQYKLAKLELEDVKMGVAETELGNALYLDALEQYPSVKATPFRHEDMALEFGGGYDSADGMIINRGRPLDQQESTAIHETQHAIQDFEGFARGGSDRDFGGDLDITESLISKATKKQIDLMNSNPEFASLKREKNRQLISLMDAYGESTPDGGKAINWDVVPESQSAAYFSVNNRLMEMPESELDYELQEQIKQLESNPRLLSPFDQYQRLAGEAEARNVQTRQDFTPEQRRQRPPWSTLDVPEEELIVRR